MWTSRYYSSVKHEGRCTYQIFDPADLQKISAFSRACKFSHAKLLSHLNQSECKANVADKKKKKKNPIKKQQKKPLKKYLKKKKRYDRKKAYQRVFQKTKTSAMDGIDTHVNSGPFRATNLIWYDPLKH